MLNLIAVFLLSTAHAQTRQPQLVCETVGDRLQSRFGVYDAGAQKVLIEFMGNTRPPTGISPAFAELVDRAPVLEMDTGGELFAVDPTRVKLTLDLASGKGTMRYFRWYGRASSYLTRSADLKLSAPVVCERAGAP